MILDGKPLSCASSCFSGLDAIIYILIFNVCLCVCRYCAGTMPWGNTGDHRDFEPQRHDDGCIEVIGFTMASLVRELVFDS